MKRELLTATALTASLAAMQGGAYAAPFDWTGVYVGLQAGLGWGSDHAQSIGSGGSSVTDNHALRYHYAFGGVTGGFNWNPGNLLFGFETDYSVFKLHDSSVAQPSGNTYDVDLENLLTMRARVGITRDRLLLFATGGLAASNTHLSSTEVCCGKTAVNSGTLVGFAAGGGFEFAATDRLTVKADALYYQLNPLHAEDRGYIVDWTPRGWTGRVGVNFKLF